MYRQLLLAAAVAAIAAPAFAQTTVKVSVAGLDAKAAQARIWTAARAACRAEFAGQSETISHYNYMDCVESAAAAAKATPIVARATDARAPAAVATSSGR